MTEWLLQFLWQNDSCKVYDRMVPGNLMTEWFLEILWQNDSCKVCGRMIPAKFMTEWFLEISWQLITPETEWLEIIS